MARIDLVLDSGPKRGLIVNKKSGRCHACVRL